MTFTLSAIACLALLCAAASAWTAPAPASSALVEENIVFGKGGDVELKLDLARPAQGAGPFPALVFVHGGGWQLDSRAQCRQEIERAAAQGYVAVTVDYRLTNVQENGKPKYPWPAQIHDVKAGVRWLRANAARYKVDPGRIGAIGGSAGGHLVLLLGLTKAKDGLEGSGGNPEVSSAVQAVANLCGPTEMAQMYDKSAEASRGFLKSLLSGTPEQSAARYREASPVTYVSAQAPPILTFHGARDGAVPTAQAQLLDEALKQAGARHEFHVVPGAGHNFEIIGAPPEPRHGGSVLDGPIFQRLMAHIYSFFDTELKASGKRAEK